MNLFPDFLVFYFLRSDFEPMFLKLQTSRPWLGHIIDEEAKALRDRPARQRAASLLWRLLGTLRGRHFSCCT